MAKSKTINSSPLIKLCISLLFLSFINGCFSSSNPEISHKKCHPKTNPKIGVFELKKANVSLKFTNYGATLISFLLPDKNGKLDDVVLGYDKAKDYVNDTTYFGAIVGRVANRIAGAKYTYKGINYKLIPNEGKNILHGGPKGFSRVIWKVHQYHPNDSTPSVTFSYFSPDGEEGFPGNLEVIVTYKIVKENHLLVSMKAKPLNKPTPVNLAQHTYWNLGGQNSGTILNHKVQIFGSEITPTNDDLIPTGNLEKVKGTPYDFLEPHIVGTRIKDLPKGYDINYVLNHGKDHGSMRQVAVVSEAKSGRVMELWTNKPGVQFYTSNMLSDEKGKGGYVYGKYAALCLETQGFPDAVHHKNFPSVMVQPGQTYQHHMLYKFSIMS